jgi:phosphohistidine phosphatase SixA
MVPRGGASRTSPLDDRGDARHVRDMRTFALAFALLFASSAFAEKAVILVRHAEKVDSSKDAALSEAGKKRAEKLRDLLAKAGVTHVFTSEFQRTKNTAAPFATAAKLVPVVVKADDEKGLIAKIQALPDDATVLVVGHSNTVPSLVKQLGGSPDVVIGDDEFGRVFIVVKRGPGAAARPDAGPRATTGGPALIELAY